MFEISGKFVEYQQGGYNSSKNPQIEIVVTKESKICLRFKPKLSKKTGLYVVLVKSSKECGRTRMSSPDAVVGKSKYYISWDVSLTCDVLPGRYIAVLTTQAKNLNCNFDVAVEKKEGIESVQVLPDYERHVYKGSFNEFHGGRRNITDNPQILVQTQGNGVVDLFCYLEDDDRRNALYMVLTKPPSRIGSRKKSFSKAETITKTKYIRWSWVSFRHTLKVSEGPFLIIPTSSNPIPFTLVLETEDRNKISKVEEIVEDESSLESNVCDCKEILDPLRTSTEWRYFDENPVPKIEEYCEKNKCKFQDSVFPAHCDESINKDDGRKKAVLKSVKSWKRPEEFLDEPAIFVEGADVEDLVQGNVGNCWLCQSIASISLRCEIINNLVYPRTISRYGVYSVKLFIEGKFRYVVIDDYIPLDHSSKPAFGHSKQKNEIYICLVEKAIAKIYKSYRALCARYLSTALTLLTGGESSNVFHSKTSPDDLFKMMLEYSENNWLMGACSEKSSGHGLVGFHAYTVLKALETSTGERLIKLRNTWGRKEWDGKYCDSDTQSWTKELASEVGLVNKNDGVFFMCVEDYDKYYNSTTFCKIVSDYLPFTKRKNGDWGQEWGGNYGKRAENPKLPLMILEDKTLLNIQMKRIPHGTQNNALQCYLVRDEILGPDIREDQIVSKSGYIYANKVRFEKEIEKKGKYHIIPCCNKKNLDRFSIIVMSSKDMDFGDHLNYEDPLPYKFEEKGKWNPCYGYYRKNPMFRLFVDEGTTKVVVEVKRGGKNVSLGMFLGIMKAGWKDSKNGMVRSADMVAKSSYLIIKNLSVTVDLEKSEEPYVIYICTQKKFAGLEYTINVKANKTIRLSKI